MSSFACANHRTWEHLTLCTIWKPLLFLPPGIDTTREVVSCQPILQVSSGSCHCLPAHLPFRPYHFLGWKVLAVSSALCSSFSSYLQKPTFSCQKEEGCSVYIHIWLVLLLCRGADSTEAFRHGNADKHRSEGDPASQRTGSQGFYLYSSTSTWLESIL